MTLPAIWWCLASMCVQRVLTPKLNHAVILEHLNRVVVPGTQTSLSFSITETTLSS
jgi:hypothetical protein